MNAVDLCIFLTTYTFVVASVCVAELVRSRRAASVLTVVVALLGIVATTVVGYSLRPGESYLEILSFLAGARDFSALASGGLGAAAALVWVTRLDSRLSATGDQSRLRHGLTQMVLALSIVGVVLCAQAFIWKGIRDIKLDPLVRVHAPGFMIEKIGTLDHPPIRVAVSEAGKVYVSYDYYANAGTFGGGIVELSKDADTGKYRQKIVADSPLLLRCYGLAARNGQLFISRSGFSATAKQGVIRYENTGAVTRLQDLDGDGYFEFTDDILNGLPGAQGPVTMQQNNAICFAPDGGLFVTTACAADRGLESHPWEGAVLRIDSDFENTEVFAKGFRNPFGLTIGPDDELFLTDNDIDENPGDELNHIVRGAHYGHPYVVPNEHLVESTGFHDPILVSEQEQNYLGMAYANSNALAEEYRNCIYITELLEHAILRVQLERSGDSYKVLGVDKFATVSSPLDIAVTPSGEFFIVSRYTKNVYRIAPTAKSSDD